jgi:hypothetical protein
MSPPMAKIAMQRVLSKHFLMSEVSNKLIAAPGMPFPFSVLPNIFNKDFSDSFMRLRFNSFQFDTACYRVLRCPAR